MIKVYIDPEQAIQNTFAKLQQELSLPLAHIQATIQLLDEGNTVPFIARYRKERTGGLDEEQIRLIQERLNYLRNLVQRKEEVLRLIDEQEKLSPELQEKILHAVKLQEVEDLYRPFKQKRRTRATIAKEKGLEGLSEWLLSQEIGDPLLQAEQYLSSEKEVLSVEDALQGAMDIIAELVSDEAMSRQLVRSLSWQHGILRSRLKDEQADEKKVYAMYYDYQEAVGKIVPHRILALNRGEKEDILKISLEVPEDRIISRIEQRWVRQETESTSYLRQAIQDSYKRLIAPSVEREVRKELTEKAEGQAITIFSKNLRQLLLQPPVRNVVVLGVDPAFRTGCKLAVVDPTGKMLAIDVIYPTAPHHQVEAAKQKVHKLIEQFGVQIIAIGNGTASRETEQFIAEVVNERKQDKLAYIIINEAGASVYSASTVAKEEFSELDVAERSAISIARRLQDPLAELVKIDPKSIGVGQYQHDVTQSRLSESLQFVVETAVNQVGVDVNTASISLLQYVSGLNKSVATQIVKQRETLGRFQERKELRQVPRLGAKTFEQAVGFLRIFDGLHPFDQTPIHFENYQEAEKFIQELGFLKEDIGKPELIASLSNLDVANWANKLQIGEPTLKDIIDALMKPRRDPRDQLAKPLLLTDILQIEDLQVGMQLEGTVRNVVDFGAFVDIGLKNDGLVHISELSDRYVAHPLDVVSVGDIVTVWVLQIDLERQRVGLTMKQKQM